MTDDPKPPRSRTSSCGVQGCLWGAVLVFVALLLAMLIIGFFRFQEPPQGVQAPAVGHHAPAPALRATPPPVLGEGARPMHASGHPTFRVDA